MNELERFLGLIRESETRERANEWFRSVVDVTEDDTHKERVNYVADFFRAWQYIQNHMQPDTATGLFFQLDPGAALHSELVMSAMYLECGYSPDDIRERARLGAFECGVHIKDPAIPGQVGIYSITEKGAEHHFYTGYFQPSDPFSPLLFAQYAARKTGTPVHEVIPVLYKVKRKPAHFIYPCSDEMLAVLEASISTGTAVGGHVFFDVDQNAMNMAQNPLLRQLPEGGGRYLPEQQLEQEDTSMYDPFFRKDNFKEEPWYNDLCIFTAIGVTEVDDKDTEAVRAALRKLGYETRTFPSKQEGRTMISGNGIVEDAVQLYDE